VTQQTVTKAIATVDDVPTDDPNGAFELILSTDQPDRDGEIVESGCFGELPDHITMDVDHGMTVETTAGSGAPSYLPTGELKVTGTYASTPLGQSVRTLVKEGHVRTASVAFLRKAMKTIDGVPHVIAAELLNGAFTPVPSNTGAVVLSAKSQRASEVVAAKSLGLKAGARNSGDDASRLQSIHDMAVENGADCTSAKSMTVGVAAATKSIEGSVEALQDRARDALEDSTDDYSYAYLRGVLPNKIVFDLGGDTFEQTYTDDGAVVTLTGDPVEVDIHEVVVPDADASTESPEPTDEPAAVAAGKAAPSDDGPAELPSPAAAVVMRARNLAAQAATGA
jgi:hypothetical protein